MAPCRSSSLPAFSPGATAAAGRAAVSSPASTTSSATTSVAPHAHRLCEACRVPHIGVYGSGRFCGASCAKSRGARRKWSSSALAAPTARRRATPTTTTAAAAALSTSGICEACGTSHDGRYASGRFCGVQCARRVAAARKWGKSRADRARRLDAIRPSVPMPLAPTPPPPPPPPPPPQPPSMHAAASHISHAASAAPLPVQYAWTTVAVAHPLHVPFALPLAVPVVTPGVHAYTVAASSPPQTQTQAMEVVQSVPQAHAQVDDRRAPLASRTMMPMNTDHGDNAQAIEGAAEALLRLRATSQR